tara:strand:+ start:4600 stop:5481 length:882 start_codon:yes stop_codon:yes gene_type:complete
MKNSYFFKLRIILEFILVYLVYLILFFLPITFVSYLGGSLFKLIGPHTKTNNIVRKNLSTILPNEKDSEINRLAKESWINTGKTFFELLILPKIIKKNYKVKIEGKKYLEQIKANNEKVIFISIHQSNWEILLPSIDILGVAVGGIYRHINNPYIDKLILRIRKKSVFSNNSFYTPKGKKSAKDIIDGINRDISIVLLIDQKDSAGEFIDLFNKPSKTQIGFIKIARKHNMKIIPVENIRDKNDSFKLKFYPPLKKFNNNVSDKEIMKEIHNIVEKWIKSHPSSWFLQHNRFS